MALDGYMFDKDDSRIDYFPIGDQLHQALFENQNKMYLSYQYLRKLSDYYCDASFREDEVRKLAGERSINSGSFGLHI
ncbi:hypothetical protein [Paenibacillus xanthanilyticus]|uniref:Uncharacterized protein n=1 Tax=Paenibacillus xanthanilyticus TaxID=1783531 RepID=A0ABV8JYD0_9BACL